MLRNSGRAVALGPRRLRLFPWLCTIDQQVSMWTTLIGPVACVCAALVGKLEFIAAYTLWVLITRTLRVSAAWRHSRRVSFCYIPLQLLSEWLGAAVKTWIYFHPVKQNWQNRGNRTLDSSRLSRLRHLRLGLASYHYGLCWLLFVLTIGAYVGLLPIVHELPLLWPH
jgi:glycosyltransferase Alg8